MLKTLENKKKKRTNVYLSEDVLEHLKENTLVKNVSDWVNKKYREEFMNISRQKKRVEEAYKNVFKQRQILNELIRKRGKIDIPELALSWIKSDGLTEIQKKGSIKAWRLFVKKFNLNFPFREFVFLVNNLENVEADQDESIR